MKILQVIHGFLPKNKAGAEVYTYNLAKELAKKHEVFVFHRINNLEEKEYAVGESSFENLKVFTINNTFRLYNCFEDVYKNSIIAKEFGRVLDRIKPDVVHIQSLLYLSVDIVNEVKKRKIPLAFTLHDYLLICPQGQLLRANSEICDAKDLGKCRDCIFYQLSIKKLAFSLYNFFQQKNKILFSLAKKIYFNYSKAFILSKKETDKRVSKRRDYIANNIIPKVDLFIAPSLFLKNKIVELGIPKDKIIFSPYGFNLNKIQNSDKILSEKIRFGFIGSILPAKGLHVLIKAFNKIKDKRAQLNIYGGLNSYKATLVNYFDSLKKLAKNKNISFKGEFDNSQIKDIFQEIDVLIVPSIWQENSPLVIQEAFLSKTSVIASDIGGIPELINDQINGFLFKVSDSEDLSKKIKLILENPACLERLKENIHPPKDIKENSQEIEVTYRGLLKINTLVSKI